MVEFTKIPPLDWQTPIVDSLGRPSPQFIRLWQQMFGNTEDNQGGLDGKVDKTTEVIAGDGLTGGGPLATNVTLDVNPGTGLEIASDAVALSNTAVTPGSYTNTDLTVDAQGRITAAANGSSGSGGLTLISTFTGNGSSGTTTFSSIPNTYKHLKLIILARSTNASTGENILIQFNGDTASNYDWQQVVGSGTTPSASQGVAVTSMILANAPGASSPANDAGVAEILIPHYAGTTWNKACVSQMYARFTNASAGLRTRQLGGNWRSTAAITSITIFLSGGNYTTGSLIELWGWN